MPVTAQDILELIGRHARRPLSSKEILAQLRLPRRDQRQVLRLLDQLVEEGRLHLAKNNRFSLPKQEPLVTGTIVTHREGYGFVTEIAGAGQDVFIPARYMRQAMNGDRAVVRVSINRQHGKPEGRIVQVLERAHRTLVGTYVDGDRGGYVTPSDPQVLHDIFIPYGKQGDAQFGQVVVVRIEDYPEEYRGASGVIQEILGEPDDPQVEILSLVHRLGLPYHFPPEVEQAAEQIPEVVVASDLGGRLDLRHLPFVTIDGETAKDFDDAVCVEGLEDGHYRLWVGIADVGHYVKANETIDLEAYERGTSIYFPGQCIPMLPERLSNGICSLNPHVDRLVMLAEMSFDSEGRRLNSQFHSGVIYSQARLTYTEVQAILDDQKPAIALDVPGLQQHVKIMGQLAGGLGQLRKARGSIDFDLPEAEILLDLRGRPENIVRSERYFSHRIIEEFMLAANEAVAEFLESKEVGFLYRIHDPPSMDRLQAFQEFIGYYNLGLELSEGGVSPRQLNRLLDEIKGLPVEKMINQILLRSLKQARYSPENVGHFGLASECYCHFTSPIRRYPDLVVHRVLRAVLEGQTNQSRPLQKLASRLEEMGNKTSACERRAMEAERDFVSLKKCQFMKDKVGQTFSGFISGVQPFGFFVELEDYFVEGLVHIASLSDDYYEYEEERHRLIGTRRRREFLIGHPVQVVVKNVQIERREIDFVLEELDQIPSRPVNGKSKLRRRK